MLLIDRALCCYCGTCVAVCPGTNLELVDTCLMVDPMCKMCGTCAGICPVGALEVSDDGRV